MSERKCVKFRVNMYEDTKFKIIDMKPERDLIHYIWTRFVTLAGKVNLEGELYVSKNIPYTIETLGIEFNRGEYQIKLALDVLIELEMIELTLDNIYRVKNFAKHQNIKVKEKIKSTDNKEHIKNKEIKLALDTFIELEMIELTEVNVYRVKNFAKHQNIKCKEKIKSKDKEIETNNQEVKVNENLKDQINYNKNEINENEAESIKNNDGDNLEIVHRDISKADNNIGNENIN